MTYVKEITTERLILRQTNLEDIELIFELLNMPKWLEFIGNRNVNNKADAKNYILKKIQPQIDKLGYGNYTVMRKSDRVKVGTCGLYDRQGLEGVDIGFGFLTQHEKNGYAYEAASKILQMGLEAFNIKKINAITTENNTASQRLLEKLGLKYVKMIRLPNDDAELMLYQFNYKPK